MTLTDNISSLCAWVKRKEAQIQQGDVWFNAAEQISNRDAIRAVEKEIARLSRIADLMVLPSKRVVLRKVLGGKNMWDRR
jgi:hypothetical protein